MTWDLLTAARTLAQEARGEPLAGQTAVAWVLKNRLASGQWGKSLASVCLWWKQFSGWYSGDPNFAYVCSLQDDDPVLVSMLSVLSDVLKSDSDPTGGALYYYALSIPAPSWAKQMVVCGEFGHQIFLKPQKETS